MISLVSFWLIDGSQTHYSTSFKGERWSVVAFTHGNTLQMTAAERMELVNLGFIIPDCAVEALVGPSSFPANRRSDAHNFIDLQHFGSNCCIIFSAEGCWPEEAS